MAFFHLLQLIFVLDGLLTTPVYSRRKDRFGKANVCRFSMFQVNRKMNNAT